METIEDSLIKLKSVIKPQWGGISIINMKDISDQDILKKRDIMMEGKLEDPFSKEINNEIIKEKERLIAEFESFYNSTQNNIKPSEVYETLIKFKIQMERLYLVINPSVSKVTFMNKEKNKKYDSGKILWLDEQGNKARISRTYGQSSEIGYQATLLKYIQELVEDEIQYEQLKYNYKNIHFDYMVQFGGESYGINFKLSHKDELIDSMARLELWKSYKKIYMN